MHIDEAKAILEEAAKQLTDEVPAHWIMLLQAMQRRLDYAERTRGRKRPPRCVHAQILDELAIPNRPCMGRQVMCMNKANEANEVYEAICRPEKCKYFEAEPTEKETP